ncbi:hypothetical protein NQ095_07100 [Rossellomorea sp. SC111]|uniref:hypothetical protein n=1 Tax=Rossellomorea sp. SC111 TaxID=2968985 RepID=UPI00215AFB91|nr:hypothetical protein [Rossellomorea sp. SC111]MCR8848164.1 hypothetical protein [Rossellomorea sp. SC111]
MTIDLKSLIGSRIQETTGTRKLTIKGETDNYTVCKIPLDLVHYNEKNGRIATYISQYLTEGNKIDKDVIEDYNMVLQKFIENSNSNAIKTTKQNIDRFGQRVPGVVLNDGRIIDGNRRFTCLRLLKNEGKDVYFEAVILDPKNGIDDRDIKRLELNLQHAEERPVDYNPIDNLVDIYRDISIDKLFTIKEYAENTNKRPKEVEVSLKKAELMVQYLEFINAPGQYFIARDMELDGPLQELVGILNKEFKKLDFKDLSRPEYPNKTEREEYLRIRNALFTAIFTNREKGDLTRYIREMGKFVIHSTNRDDFLDEYEEVVEEVYETLQDQEEVTTQTVKEIGKELEVVRKEGKDIIDRKIQDTQIKVARKKPVELLNQALADLERIDLDQVSRLKSEDEKEFRLVLGKIDSMLKKFGGKIEV